MNLTCYRGSDSPFSRKAKSKNYRLRFAREASRCGMSPALHENLQTLDNV